MFQYLKFLGNGKTLITLAIKLQKNSTWSIYQQNMDALMSYNNFTKSTF
jgi:hypothetical protein